MTGPLTGHDFRVADRDGRRLARLATRRQQSAKYEAAQSRSFFIMQSLIIVGSLAAIVQSGEFMAWQKSRHMVTSTPASISTKPIARSAFHPQAWRAAPSTTAVLTDIGSFGGGFRLKGYRDPVLVSSADGVGTKLKLAFLTGRHSTIGEDLVNHCVNDIAVQGAVPVVFPGLFRGRQAGRRSRGVRWSPASPAAARHNGCALIGGETAEMPGLYAPGEYDLAGFIVGAVERKRMLTGASIRVRRRSASACPRPVCTPTVIRSRASCCSKSPATRPTPASKACATPSPTNCSSSIAAI